MIGRSIDHYRVLDCLGEGGMGTVYRAFDTILERDVAIKVVRPDYGAQPEIARRFRVEAITLARLSHPHIATLYALAGQGEPLCMVMELVRGETLDRVLRRDRVLPWRRAIRLAGQMLDALEYAHAAGVVHRDIKPANVMVAPGPHVKLTDFGIARMLDRESFTRKGFTLGTLEYSAPEQMLGQEVDGRADLYAVGVVLYEMLTGRLPFEAERDHALIYAHLQRHVTPPDRWRDDLPRWLSDAVVRAMAKPREDRWASARAFADAITPPDERASTAAAATVVLDRPGGRRSNAASASASASASAAADAPCQGDGLAQAWPSIASFPRRLTDLVAAPATRVAVWGRQAFHVGWTRVDDIGRRTREWGRDAWARTAASLSAGRARSRARPADRAHVGDDVRPALTRLGEDPRFRDAGVRGAMQGQGRRSLLGVVAIWSALAIVAVLAIGAIAFWRQEPSPAPAFPQGAQTVGSGPPAASGAVSPSSAASVPPSGPPAPAPPRGADAPAGSPGPEPIPPIDLPVESRPRGEGRLPNAPAVDPGDDSGDPIPDQPPELTASPAAGASPPVAALPDEHYDVHQIVTLPDGDTDELDMRLTVASDRLIVSDPSGARPADVLFYSPAPAGAVRAAGATLQSPVRMLGGSEHRLILPTLRGQVVLLLDSDQLIAIVRAFESRSHRRIVWGSSDPPRP